MSRHLATVDGLFLGSSAAVNLVACVRLAKKWGKNSGKTVVTILWLVAPTRRCLRVLRPFSGNFLIAILELGIIVDSGESLICSISYPWTDLCLSCRNDEYLTKEGIPVSSSIESILQE